MTNGFFRALEGADAQLLRVQALRSINKHLHWGLTTANQLIDSLMEANARLEAELDAARAELAQHALKETA